MIDKGNRWLWPALGSIAVLAISPLVTALTGQVNAYALVLLPLTLLMWAVTRLSSRDLGIRLGNLNAYVLSLLYPISVMVLTGIAVWLTGYIRINALLLSDVGRRVLYLFLIYFIGALLTEEVFFRGWLWGALEKRDFKLRARLVWTGGVFSMWHFAVTIILPELHFSPSIVPIYLGNIFLIGLFFGLLRQKSGSILAPSVCHALWNAMLYTLYGTGDIAGVLDIASPRFFDPERGLLGLLLNLIAVVLLWRIAARRENGK
ncbi:MAG: lysostaphin resistance A-like protein, partial [Acidobacteriota bacterium]